MLIKDEAVVARHQEFDPIVAERERQVRWAREQLERCRVILSKDSSPTNWERQAGRKLTPEALETHLKRLNGRLYTEVIEGKPLFRYLWESRPDGRHKICLFHNFLMPEYSIFDSKEQVLTDPNFTALHRNDLPKYRWGGLEYDDETGDVRGEGYIFESGVQPGMLRVPVAWHELVRGWRTVVAQCVAIGLFTPEAAEIEFGSSDRRSWAEVAGKAAPSTNSF